MILTLNWNLTLTFDPELEFFHDFVHNSHHHLFYTLMYRSTPERELVIDLDINLEICLGPNT